MLARVVRTDSNRIRSTEPSALTRLHEHVRPLLQVHLRKITGINYKFPCTVEIFPQVNDVCWLERRPRVTDDSTTRLQPDIQRSTQRRLWSPFARNHLLHQLHHHMLHDRHQHVHCNHSGKLQPSASRGGDRHC